MRSRDRWVAAAAAVGVVAASGGFSVLSTKVEQDQAAAAQASVQRQAQRQGRRELKALCLTFGKLAALKPPAGNPHTNPSRAYLQGEHATLDEIGTDLKCER
jgi:type II secretory pathway pseudopilin PulG